MRRMNNLEYAFLADELARALAGKHFGRIRKLGENAYRMKIAGFEVMAELGTRIHLTKYIAESESADKFVEKAGKELENARLLAVEQLNKDRILAFEFDKGKLIFEMFGEGNVVLVRGGITICAHRYESWSDRQIKGGEPYSPPRNVPQDSIEPGEKYIIVSLMRLPLGKEYAQEALIRCGIDEKEPGRNLSGNKLLRLEQEISSIRSEARPYVFLDGQKIIDYALSPLTKYSGLATRMMPSLSEAADEFYQYAEKPNPELEKLLGRLEKQKERLASLLEEEREYRAKGDFIYEKYAEAENLISMAKAGKFAELEKSGAAVNRKERFVEAEL